MAHSGLLALAVLTAGIASFYFLTTMNRLLQQSAPGAGTMPPLVRGLSIAVLALVFTALNAILLAYRMTEAFILLQINLLGIAAIASNR